MDATEDRSVALPGTVRLGQIKLTTTQSWQYVSCKEASKVSGVPYVMNVYKERGNFHEGPSACPGRWGWECHIG